MTDIDYAELLARARREVAPYREELDRGEWVTGIGNILNVERLADALERVIVDRDRYRDQTIWRDTIEEQRSYIKTLEGERAALRDQIATAWDEGWAAADINRPSSRKGHWEQDRPRKGLRTWIPDPLPVNPYRAVPGDLS